MTGCVKCIQEAISNSSERGRVADSRHVHRQEGGSAGSERRARQGSGHAAAAAGSIPVRTIRAPGDPSPGVLVLHAEFARVRGPAPPTKGFTCRTSETYWSRKSLDSPVERAEAKSTRPGRRRSGTVTRLRRWSGTWHSSSAKLSCYHAKTSAHKPPQRLLLTAKRRGSAQKGCVCIANALGFPLTTSASCWAWVRNPFTIGNRKRHALVPSCLRSSPRYARSGSGTRNHGWSSWLHRRSGRGTSPSRLPCARFSARKRSAGAISTRQTISFYLRSISASWQCRPNPLPLMAARS